MVCILANLTMLNILAYFVMMNTELDEILRNVYKFILIWISCFYYLTVLEVSLINFWIKFVWKRVPPIDDQFAPLFNAILKTIIANLVSASRFLTNEDVAMDARFLGVDISLAPSPKIRMR